MHLHVAQADVDNCFHRMRMPFEMQRWFSLPCISAADLGGVRIDENTPVLPLLGTLPMGFSWSLFFAQSAHEAIVEEHGRLGKGLAELLGHTVKAIEGTISTSPKRAWPLRDAMLHASRLRKLSGMALEVILGRTGFCFLVRRCLLSVFGRAYAFVQAHYSAPAPLVALSATRTWECCIYLAVGLFKLAKTLDPNVWCVDAAPRGVAAHTSSWRVWSVAVIGRLEERLRWKLTGGLGLGPRELALADVSEDVVNGEWKMFRGSCFHHLCGAVFIAAKSPICPFRFISNKPKLLCSLPNIW